MKILSLHCIEGPQAPQHKLTAVDTQKTRVTWQPCSHTCCCLVLMGVRGSGASRHLQMWEVGGAVGGSGGGQVLSSQMVDGVEVCWKWL
jgi:hypothetical protein